MPRGGGVHSVNEKSPQPGTPKLAQKTVWSRRPKEYRGLAVRQFLRRNLLLFIGTAIFIAATVLVFVQIDTVYYSNDKREALDNLFLREDPRGFWADSLWDVLPSQVNTYLIERERAAVSENPRQIESIQARRDQLHGTMQQLMANNPMIWKVSVRDASGNVLLEVAEPERIARQNDWSNSLFFRDWTRVLRRLPRDGNRGIGSLEVHHTSIKGVPEIEQLTRRWRAISSLVGAGMLGFYLLVLWGLLLPTRSLIRALDKGPADEAPLIRRPRRLLEKYYNNLARDATLSVLSTELREYVRNRTVYDPPGLFGFASDLVARLFPVDGVSIVIARWDADARRWSVEGRFPDGPDGAGEEAFVRWAEPCLAAAAEDNGGTAEPQTRGDWEFTTAFWSEEGRVDLLHAHGAPAAGGTREWWFDLYRDLARELRFAVEIMAEQRRLIMTEKRKANISLSRNLGHDLTNIIATSKLELMTIKTFLELPSEELRGAPMKEQIFRESLQALLNSTRFLQETVNLYRSFTYMSHPKYEKVRLCELVEDVRELFQLSISTNVSIELDLDGSLEPLEVEPRLLRLALFNLLANAADAIKRSSSTERPTGVVTIRTARGEAPGTQEIAVEDSGDGIRSADGGLMPPEDIAYIFNLGYTTKEKGSGEGLGLNWVQQIVRDFHGGEISATNRGESGARFVVTLYERAAHGPGATPDDPEGPAQP